MAGLCRNGGGWLLLLSSVVKQDEEQGGLLMLQKRGMFIARIGRFCIIDRRIDIACTNSVELQGIRGVVRSCPL
jgi:hypothetical protein